MGFEQYWAPSARRDLRRIVDFFSHADPDGMPLAVGPLIRKIDLLAEFPYSGDVWQRSGSHEIREIVAGSYRVFFEVNPDEQTVTIRYLRHVRQQDPEFAE